MYVLLYVNLNIDPKQVPGSVSFLDSSRRTRYRIHMIHTSTLATLVEYETGKDENVFYGVTCAVHDLLDHYENTQNQVLTKHWKYYLESFYQDLPDEIAWFLKFGARPCVIEYIKSNDFSPLKNKTFLAMLLCVASAKCTRSIKLSAVDLTSECIEVLGTTLDEVPSICNLEISKCRFPSLCTEQLAQLLVCGKNLTSLVLCDNRVVNDRVMKLFHSLTPKFSTQLQVLRLSGCNLSVTGLEALASTLTSLGNKTEDSVLFTALTELDLSHNNLVGATPQALVHLFACSPHLSVIRLAYCGSSLEWLPSALSRGCRNVLKVLDISGNDFDHFPTNEWHALFATTVNLEQLSLCNCQGPYLGETVKMILCGLSRLQGRAKSKRLSVALANNQLGRPGAKPLSYHILLLADLLTELDLSECELGDHALDVFNSLESCVNLETLTLNGPWTGLSTNVQRSIMISLSNLLKTPNCHLRHLSLSNVDLGENVLYLLADLLNYPSLEDLDLSGNRMGDGVAHILARLISARSNRLRFLHFDRNQLSLTAIEELVQAAATNDSHVKLRVPLYDLMTHLNHNEVMCYQLTSKIEALYAPKSKLSSSQWWNNWAESENIQTTIHCVTRLSHNTRQLYTEVQKRSKSLDGVHVSAASVENGTDHENGNNHNSIRRWLNDADHVKDLLNKFIATAQDYIEDFIRRSSDLIISRMQSGIESHLEHLGLSMRETAQRICSTQCDTGSISVRELIRNAQGRVSKGLKEVVQSKFLPELEKQLNKVSSDLISSMFDAVVGDIIDGLDNSHRQLISQLCPDSSKLRSTTRLSVRTQWLQSRGTQETSTSRRYPIDEFLSKRQLTENDDSQNDNQMLLRGLGIRVKSPKASPIHAILTASSATHVVSDKQSASESKYLSLPTLGVQMISVSGKQKSTSLHHSSFTKSDMVLTKVHTENKTDDVDLEFQSNVTSSSPTPTPPLRRKHIDRGPLSGQQSTSTSQENESSVITVWRRNDLTSSRIHSNRNPRVDSVRLEPLRFFNLVRPKLANYLPSSLDEDIESTDDDVLYSNSTKNPVVASHNAWKSDEPNGHTRLQRIKSDPELELVDSTPTELYYTPCSNLESTKPWETHDINILKNQTVDTIPPVRHKDPDSIKIVKKSGPPSTTSKSTLDPPQKKGTFSGLYDKYC
ncbi:hypothetical protein PHET_04202 [Paragonimus heterotremus]|uniref:CARMIL C-terminal domain-containing protein n=1 Tax=Paragonimus heterotremus TaxID=100268 RepID=A0A8J4WHM1_9TREM|nr:hypothetical protein PHET_04202 [Paragonimus heterotremus]